MNDARESLSVLYAAFKARFINCETFSLAAIPFEAASQMAFKRLNRAVKYLLEELPFFSSSLSAESASEVSFSFNRDKTSCKPEPVCPFLSLNFLTHSLKG